METKTKTHEPGILLPEIIAVKPEVAGQLAKKKTRKKLTKLDAVRGFAALYVICHHSLPRGTMIDGIEFDFFKYGKEAVILFFLLSGFVIQYAYITSADKSFKSYFLKRFLRIYIPLILVFIANYLIISIKAHHPYPISWRELGGNLLMLQQISEIWQQPVMVAPFLNNLPLWTLSFEWWFYMIFFFAVTRYKDKASNAVYIAGIVAAITYVFYPCFVNREFLYLLIWWAGTDLAKVYVNNNNFTLKDLKLSLYSLIITCGILVLNIIYYKYLNPGKALVHAESPVVELRNFVFTIAFIVGAVYWRKFNWIGFKYTLGLFRPFAAISFGLYISHYFLVATAKWLQPYIGNLYERAFFYFLVCCAFSYVIELVMYPYLNKRIMSFFMVKEKPFVNAN